MDRAVTYAASGDVFGQFTVTREDDVVTAVTGRGRIVSGGTEPAPFLAFDLRRRGARGRLMGTIMVRDPGAGLERTFEVVTSAVPSSPTAADGSGVGIDLSRQAKGSVRVRWSIDDLAS